MNADAPDDVSIRPAEPADRLGIRRVIDAAYLEVEDLQDRIEAGGVFVATASDRVVGTAVIDPEGIDAGDATDLPESWRDAAYVRSIAVTRRRRGRGIGTALVEAALDAFGPLVGDFEPGVAPFYRTVAAEIRVEADGHHWAILDPERED